LFFFKFLTKHALLGLQESHLGFCLYFGFPKEGHEKKINKKNQHTWQDTHCLFKKTLSRRRQTQNLSELTFSAVFFFIVIIIVTMK